MVREPASVDEVEVVVLILGQTPTATIPDPPFEISKPSQNTEWRLRSVEGDLEPSDFFKLAAVLVPDRAEIVEDRCDGRLPLFERVVVAEPHSSGQGHSGSRSPSVRSTFAYGRSMITGGVTNSGASIFRTALFGMR